ncbi:MAG: ester cyclase [Anaerolineae bacterium]|jgi:predicted ester cyclase
MSKENLDTVRRAIEEVWNCGNLTAIPDLFAANFITFEPSNQVLSGWEAFGQYVSSYRATFPQLHFTIEDSQPRRDEVSIRWTATGIAPASQPARSANGNGSGVSGMTIFRLDSGKIVESWVHWDTAGMLQRPGTLSRTS